jgi:hypothetical protein
MNKREGVLLEKLETFVTKLQGDGETTLIPLKAVVPKRARS